MARMGRVGLVALGATALVLTIGLGVDTAERAAAASEQAQRPPTRLWYRIRADLTLTRRGMLTFGPTTETRTTTSSLRLRSRTAVILFRQCTASAPGNKRSPKLVARRLGLPTSHTCGQLRRAARRAGVRPSVIRAARLVEDVRFTAGAQGTVFGYEKRAEIPERVTPAPSGIPITMVCPPSTFLSGRLTGPDPIRGLLTTGSAVRTGVALNVVTSPLAVSPVERGGESGPCIIRETGAEARAASQFHTQPYSLGQLEAFRGPEVPDPIRFRVGRRFGRNFTRMGTTNRTLSYPNGSEQVTITTKLTFRRCPRRGGRTNAGC